MHIAWQRRAFTAERLDARDLMWLCTLGAATRRPIPLDAPPFAIDELVGFLWQPARDVVAGAVDEMLRLGCLGLEDATGEPRLATTAEGRACLLDLMAGQLEGPRSLLGQVGVRLKVAHVDLLNGERRRQILADLIKDYEPNSSRCASISGRHGAECQGAAGWRRITTAWIEIWSCSASCWRTKSGVA